MEDKHISIPLNNLRDKNILVNLEQDFSSVENLILKITSSGAYKQANSNFGVLTGRVTINGGFGVQNAKIGVFVPLSTEDKTRREILDIYPFETISDLYPNGVRYNLLPRVKQQNPDHVPVGTFPDVTDLTHYPVYLEVFQKYYKYTTTTNENGDYMIFGVPTGTQTVFMDFDLLDTKSLSVNAVDLVYLQPFGREMLQNDQETPDPDRLNGFIYHGNQKYSIEPNTTLDAMPNIFSEQKPVNILSFWGESQTQIGITRCDFHINHDYIPTATFFGSLLSGYPSRFVIDQNYTVNNNLTINEIDKFKNLKIVVWCLNENDEPEYFGTFSGVDVKTSREDEALFGVFNINLPMYRNYYRMSEFGEIIPSDDGVGIPTVGRYAFEFYDADEHWNGRLELLNNYSRNLLPGVRVPSDPYGDPKLGGWTGLLTDDALFTYDINNAKRNFYTIATTYLTKQETNVFKDGNYLGWLPNNNLISGGERISSGFPIDNRISYNETDNTTVIGCALLPRINMLSSVTLLSQNEKEKEIDSNYIVNTSIPTTVVNFIKPTETYLTRGIGTHEWILGLNVKPNGVRNGDPMATYYNMGDNNRKLIYGKDGESLYDLTYLPNDNETTWNYGPNGYNGIVNDLTAYYIQVRDNIRTYQPSQLNSENVFDMFTIGGINKYGTSGPFVNSSLLNGGSGILSTKVYQITSELSDLINKKINTSARFTIDENLTTDLSKNYLYKGKRYYFGKTYESSALKSIENTYYE